MKRRGNNEGSISKRPDGRWMGQVSMPDGKRRTVYGKSRGEVKKRLDELLEEAEHSFRLAPGQAYHTIGEFFEAWLLAVAPSVKPKTAQYYRNYIKWYTQDLAPFTLPQLKAQHLQKLYAQLLKRGLSSSTVHHLHAVLHRAFASGVKQGVFLQNLCDFVDAPRMAKQEMLTFNADQARQFLDAIKGNRYEALFALALSTGMRQGELLGLAWNNVDLDRGVIYVKRNLQWIEKEAILQDPKTEKSRRMIFIGGMVRELLVAHRQQQIIQREAMAGSWKDKWNLVFTNVAGGPMHPSPLVHNHFEPVLKAANLPDLRFHDLRHTAATLLLEAGINPKVVSEMLGHSSVNITLSLYSHATPAMHYTASVVMDKVLRGEIIQLALPSGME